MNKLGMPKITNPMKTEPRQLENPMKKSNGKNVHIAKLTEKLNRKF